MPEPSHLRDVKQGQRPARRLLEAAISISVERPQQGWNIPIGPRTDAQQRFGGARQKLARRPVIEGDTFSRLQPPDETPELVGLPRAHADREFAGNLQIARPGKFQFEGCTARGRGRQHKAIGELAA